MGHMDSGDETVRFGTEGPDPLAPQPVRRKRIVVAEDDPDLRSLIQCSLEVAQYLVFCCGDGLQAMEIFRGTQDIDLLITDLQMPLMSGEELTCGLCELYPKLAIIFISGTRPSAHLRDLMREHRWHFLAKPFSLPELLGAVHQRIGASGYSA